MMLSVEVHYLLLVPDGYAPIWFFCADIARLYGYTSSLHLCHFHPSWWSPKHQFKICVPSVFSPVLFCSSSFAMCWRCLICLRLFGFQTLIDWGFNSVVYLRRSLWIHNLKWRGCGFQVVCVDGCSNFLYFGTTHGNIVRLELQEHGDTEVRDVMQLPTVSLRSRLCPWTSCDA